jgi:16S rRNA (uracil1498-N3)-methyltransferase
VRLPVPAGHPDRPARQTSFILGILATDNETTQMRLVRLFVDIPLRPGDQVPLPARAARHALRVLRLQAGDRVTLFNGDGRQYPARVTADDPRMPHVRVEACESPECESPLRTILLQSVARGEKMDWIIQKATELGVSRITPVVSERSEVRLDAARGARRLEHWRAVAVAACEQCGRNVVPPIDPPVVLASCMASLEDTGATARWMLHPGGSTRVRDIAAVPASMLLAVGPEGGFGDQDLTILRDSGFRELALGPRVLRTETAGIAALAALQAVCGDA